MINEKPHDTPKLCAALAALNDCCLCDLLQTGADHFYTT